MIVMLEFDRLNEAMSLLGALLEERGQQVGVLVIGGGSLLLLGVIERPTKDIDIVGLQTADGYRKAEGLPAFLTTAVQEVGAVLDLGEDWFNCGPADLFELGLPSGLEDRVRVLTFGGLEVHLPAIEDLVCFKLYAAVDQGERSKHFLVDLPALAPTREQLLNAARWTRTHDPSSGFRGELQRILGLLGVEVGDGDL